ncbi:MAG TPA: hypothetical protein VGG04_01790 [Candidatus Sulfotelmatobacter sp.]|jgi:hypothetical protein
MSTLAKLGIAALGVVLVGGAAGAVGVYYVAHKVSQKYHEVKDEVLESSPSSASGSGENARDNGSDARSPAGGSDSSSNSMGNVCRFLSKEDVSKAIGVEIIRTEPGDNSCAYIAKGTQREMTAKHAAAMLGDKGADKKTQQIAEQFAGGIFKMTQENKPESAQDASGEVPVFNFGLNQNDAEAQMRLNAKGLAVLGSQEGLPGIGDQAFVQADGMIMVRKGKTLVQIMYLTCPCGLEQVKPLAKEIVDAL